MATTLPSPSRTVLILVFSLAVHSVALSQVIFPTSLPISAKFTLDAKLYSQGNTPVWDRLANSGVRMTTYFYQGIYQGVHYRYYLLDASASFQGSPGEDLFGENDWNVSCKKDEITDVKLCYLIKRDLTVEVKPDGSFVAIIGGFDRLPNSQVAIRTDSKPPYFSSSGELLGKEVTSLIEDIKRAGLITTRYQTKSGTQKTSQFEAYGFPQVLDYATWVLTRIK